MCLLMMRVAVVILVLGLQQVSVWGGPVHWLHALTASGTTAPFSPGCPGCGKSRLEESLSHAQLAEFRMSMVKAQILNKLRLTEPPRASEPRPALPAVLASSVLQQLQPRPAPPLPPAYDVDEFYGKTEQLVIFPHQGCEVGIACFVMPNTISREMVSETQLWIHPAELAPSDFALLLRPHISSNSSMLLSKNISQPIPITINSTGGWVKLAVPADATSWLQSGAGLQVSGVLNLTIPGDTWLRDTLSPQQGHRRPFLVIHTRPPHRGSGRGRRHVNCQPGVRECCRERLRVDFASLGWDDWILHPRGYDAYFCRGSCVGPAAAVTRSETFHTTVLQRYMQSQPAGSRANKLPLAPCCTPTKLSSLQLMYVDGNNVVVHKTLPNMVVEACGCL